MRSPGLSFLFRHAQVLLTSRPPCNVVTAAESGLAAQSRICQRSLRYQRVSISLLRHIADLICEAVIRPLVVLREANPYIVSLYQWPPFGHRKGGTLKGTSHEWRPLPRAVMS